LSFGNPKMGRENKAWPKFSFNFDPMRKRLSEFRYANGLLIV